MVRQEKTPVRFSMIATVALIAVVVCVVFAICLLVWDARKGVDVVPLALPFLGLLVAALVGLLGAMLTRSWALMPGATLNNKVPGEPGEETMHPKKNRAIPFLLIASFFLFALSICIVVWGVVHLSIRSHIELRIPGIRITTVPISGGGGPAEKARICGTVKGVDPGMYRVVLFSEANMWYVEPDTVSPITAIQPDGTWCNTIFLGQDYAALLVKSGYAPPATSQTLPQVGGDVVASAIETGKTK